MQIAFSFRFNESFKLKYLVCALCFNPATASHMVSEFRIQNQDSENKFPKFLPQELNIELQRGRLRLHV